MSDYAYTGKTIVDVGDKVEITDEDGNKFEGTVRVVLAVQFLVDVPKQGSMFRFYADRGDTWQLIRKQDTLPLKRNVLNFPTLRESAGHRTS